MSLELKIQQLQDRSDILEILYAYCRHADQLNAAGEFGGERIGEQFGRPWPPRFDT